MIANPTAEVGAAVTSRLCAAGGVAATSPSQYAERLLDECLYDNRLAEEGIAPRFNRLVAEWLRSEGAHSEDRDVPLGLESAQHARHTEPADSGKDQIEHDDIGIERPRQIKAFLSGRGIGHDEAGGLELVHERLTRVRRVFDDERPRDARPRA